MKEYTPDVLMIGSPYQKGDGVFDSTELFVVHFIDPADLTPLLLSRCSPRLIVVWARRDMFQSVMAFQGRVLNENPIPVLVVGPSSQAAFFLEAGAAYFVDEAAPTAVLVRGIEVMLGVFSVRPVSLASRELRAVTDPLQLALEEAQRIALESRLDEDAMPRVAPFQNSASLKKLIEVLEDEWLPEHFKGENENGAEGLESVDLQGYVAPREQVEDQMSGEERVSEVPLDVDSKTGLQLEAAVQIPQSARRGRVSETPIPTPTPVLDEIARRIVAQPVHTRATQTLVLPHVSAGDAGELLHESARASEVSARVPRTRAIRVRAADMPVAALTNDFERAEAAAGVAGPFLNPGEDVIAAAQGPGAVVESGTVRDVPVWKLFVRLMRQQFSGDLMIASQGVQRTIAFEKGEPIMVTSNAREDRLIELLHREGRLSEAQYANASLTIGASGRKAGVVLVEKGLIAPRELFPLVRYHYESLLSDSLVWSDGEYRLSLRDTPVTEHILLDTPGVAIVMEGLRSRATDDLLNQLVPVESLPVRTEQSGLGRFAELGLSPREMEILDGVDGHQTVAQIAARFSTDFRDLRAMIAGLAVLGWVAVSAIDALPSDSLAMHTDRNIDLFGGVPGGIRLTSAEISMERLRVEGKMTQVREASYFALLEVSENATLYEIRKSYRRLKDLFQPQRFTVRELMDLHGDLEIIGLVLDEAFEVLRDDALRETYRVAHV